MQIADLVPLGSPAGRSRWTIEHAGRQFVVLVVADDLVVLDAVCPHKQGPLAKGLIRDGAIVCPSHWYAFDVQTGACRTANQYALTRYPVIVQDGVPYAEIPPARKRSWAEILRLHASSGT